MCLKSFHTDISTCWETKVNLKFHRVKSAPLGILHGPPLSSSSSWLCICIPYNHYNKPVNINQSVSLSSGHHSKLLNLREKLWESLSINKWIMIKIIDVNSKIATSMWSRVAVLQDLEIITCGVCAISQVIRVRIEFIIGYLLGVHRILRGINCYCGRNTHLFQEALRAKTVPE